MEYNVIGSFYAVTFDKRIIEIVVLDNDTISIPSWGLDEITFIKMKPRIELYDVNKNKYIPCRYKTKDDLIVQFVVSDELLNYLREKCMIRYSTDMAYLYDFNNKEGYDRLKKGGKPFKWALKKPGYKVLEKQKQGYFNI